MPTVKARDILERASKTLLDEAGVRWKPEELLEALTDGQREVVMLRPAAYSVNETVELAQGTRQEVPSGGHMLLDCIRSMGTDGNSPGRAIRPVQRHTIDATRPDWHSESEKDEPKHYVFDERDPKHYYVYPPNTGSGHIEIVYSASPPEIEDQDETIALDDAYATPLFYYVMYRALLKEGSSVNPNAAGAYYEMFRASVTGRTEAVFQSEALRISHLTQQPRPDND